MRVIGLTGGIASGKSTVADVLRARGVRVIDADQLAREAVAPGSQGLSAIVEAFGGEILDADGGLDRSKMRGIVFEDREARARLNAIVHPEVGRLSRERMEAAQEEGLPLCVYEAALLVENGIHQGLDGLIVVSTAPGLQVERLMARDGLDQEAARRHLEAQLPLAQKVAVADWVIHNDGDLPALEAEVSRVWAAVEQTLGDGARRES